MAEKQVAEKKEEPRKPLVINEAVLKLHNDNHTFRSAGPGKSHDSPITGAQSRWFKKNGDEIVYDPTFRTVGTEEQIREELTRAGVSQREIEEALEKAYTFEAVSQDGEIRDQYLAELEGAKMAAFTPRSYGMEWSEYAHFFQAKKSEIIRKGKASKGKRRGEGKRGKVSKKKSAADVQKDLVEKKSEFVLVFGTQGFSRMKETSIGLNYYFNKDLRLAFQTPEEMANAKAALSFGEDIEKEFQAWYAKREGKKPAPVASSSAAAPKSPVKAMKSVPARRGQVRPAAEPETEVEHPKTAGEPKLVEAPKPAAAVPGRRRFARP